jgi:anti-sigma B factor antagonist
MNLTLQIHRTGNIVILECHGQIVEGDSDELRRRVDDLLIETPCLVLDLAGVDFIDSSGLGLLVLLATRTRMAGGDLKLCAIPAGIDRVLTVTCLKPLFGVYASPSEAEPAFSMRSRPQAVVERLEADILCVHRSTDVLAFVRTLLKHAGYGVVTTDNLSDALMLLQGSAPRAVVMDSDLRGIRTTPSAARFNDLIDTLAVVELSPEFPTRDAGMAGRELIERVAARLG